MLMKLEAPYPNSGIMFENRDEGTNPKWSGKVNVDGVEYGIAAWPRQSKNGNTFWTLKLTPLKNGGWCNEP
jgi:hypothetical protein